MSATLWLALAVITVSGLCDTVTHVGFKISADRVGLEVSGVASALRFGARFLSTPLAWVAIVFSVLSLLLFMFALTLSDLSFAFSVDSIHHVFIAAASARILKEKISPQRWLGTLIIMLGIVLVAMSGAG